MHFDVRPYGLFCRLTVGMNGVGCNQNSNGRTRMMLLLFLQHSPCYTWKNRHVQVELSRNAAAEAQVARSRCNRWTELVDW
jgi:hypothetical protein